MNDLYTKTGMLTTYSLACGYIDRDESGFLCTTLWREHGVYHVKQLDFLTHERKTWNTFATLAEARESYENLTTT